MFRWVLDKNAVVTEEKLKEIEARLELLPHKFMTRLSQQAQVLGTTAWRVIKKLCLWPYEIRQVQAIEDGDYERRMHFCDWFLEAVPDSFLGQKLSFFLTKLGST